MTALNRQLTKHACCCYCSFVVVAVAVAVVVDDVVYNEKMRLRLLTEETHKSFTVVIPLHWRIQVQSLHGIQTKAIIEVYSEKICNIIFRSHPTFLTFLHTLYSAKMNEIMLCAYALMLSVFRVPHPLTEPQFHPPPLPIRDHQFRNSISSIRNSPPHPLTCPCKYVRGLYWERCKISELSMSYGKMSKFHEYRHQLVAKVGNKW